MTTTPTDYNILESKKHSFVEAINIQPIQLNPMKRYRVRNTADTGTN